MDGEATGSRGTSKQPVPACEVSCRARRWVRRRVSRFAPRTWVPRPPCGGSATVNTISHPGGRPVVPSSGPADYHRRRDHEPNIHISPLLVAGFRHPDGSALAGSPGIGMVHAVIHPDGSCSSTPGSAWVKRRSRARIDRSCADFPTSCVPTASSPTTSMALANSHLHFDHRGQSAAFPGAPDPCQAREYDAGQAAECTVPSWFDCSATTIGGSIPGPSRFSDLWGCVVSTGLGYRGTRAEDATGPR